MSASGLEPLVMRSTLLFLLACVLATALQHASAAEKPNVRFIAIDDLNT